MIIFDLFWDPVRLKKVAPFWPARDVYSFQRRERKSPVWHDEPAPVMSDGDEGLF